MERKISGNRSWEKNESRDCRLEARKEAEVEEERDRESDGVRGKVGEGWEGRDSKVSRKLEGDACG